MVKFSKKIHWGLVLGLLLMLFATVRAATSYSVTADFLSTDAFPAVVASLKITGDTANLVPRNLKIVENGTENHGALVLIPAGPVISKIDLFILRDAGNLKENGPVVDKKLESLTDYLNSGVVDAKVVQTTYTSDASGKTDAFKKISDLASTPARTGAQKVLLILNGSSFYDMDRGDANTTQSATDIIKLLTADNFITFVAGAPFRSLEAFRSDNTEEASLSHSMAGGYLGSYSTDLTRLVDLLKNRDTGHFALYYTSGLMPAEASGASVDLFVGGFLAGHLSYPAISAATPTYSYLTTPTVMLGDPVPIRIEVSPQGKMVAEAELTYQDQNSAFQTRLLKFDRASSAAEKLVYEGEIPKGDYPPDNLNYFVKLYTPFDLVGTGNDMKQVGIESVDDGIIIKPQLVNNKEVLWSWSGKTVDMGSEYEIWSGDKKLNNGSLVVRSYSIPITECDRYQIVKVRVKLRAGVDHPRAGDWSLFSRPGEYYYPDPGVTQDSVTEAFGVQKLVECLSKSVYESPAAFIAAEKTYKPSANLTLNKALYDLTAILQPSLKDTVRYDRYSLLYLFMNVISQSDYDTYNPDTKNIPASILYKVITGANQLSDFQTVFKSSLDELAVRLRGNTSI